MCHRGYKRTCTQVCFVQGRCVVLSICSIRSLVKVVIFPKVHTSASLTVVRVWCTCPVSVRSLPTNPLVHWLNGIPVFSSTPEHCRSSLFLLDAERHVSFREDGSCMTASGAVFAQVLPAAPHCEEREEKPRAQGSLFFIAFGALSFG